VTGQILVPLRKGDRIEDVVPYLEQIAQPGSKVTLLVHYSVEGLDWLQGKSTTSVVKEQKPVADENTFLALESLRERDVKVALDIYAGPLTKVVKQYALRGDIDLVMIAARGKSWIGRLLQNCPFFFNFSRLSKSSSMLLLRPDIPKHEQ
jgi:nucleotide-binding universal stress UspA family protein